MVCPVQCLFLFMVPQAVLREHVCLLWCQLLKVREFVKHPELLSLGTESIHSIQWNWHIEPRRSALCEWPVTGCFANGKAYFANWYHQQRHLKQLSILWPPDIFYLIQGELTEQHWTYCYRETQHLVLKMGKSGAYCGICEDRTNLRK